MHKCFDCLECRADLVRVYLFIEAETLSQSNVKLRSTQHNFVSSNMCPKCAKFLFRISASNRHCSLLEKVDSHFKNEKLSLVEVPVRQARCTTMSDFESLFVKI